MPRKTFPEPQKYKSEGVVIGYMARWRTPDGKRPYKLFRFADFDGDKKKAAYDAAKAEIERQIGERRAVRDGQRVFVSDSMTLAKFFDDVYYKEESEAHATPKDDLYQFNAHLREPLGGVPINKITTDDVDRLRTSLRKTYAKEAQRKPFIPTKRRPNPPPAPPPKPPRLLSPQTQKSILSALRKILRYATGKGTGLVPTVPKFKMPRVAKKKARAKGEADLMNLLTVAKADRLDVWAIIGTALYTGMREGEIAGLHWCDVDLKARKILVAYSWDRNQTKNGKDRWVSIFDALVPILEEWKEATKDRENKLGLVFPNDDGEIWRHDSPIFRVVWRRIKTAAGLPTLTFHGLRHQFVAHFAADGGNLAECIDMVGHMDERMLEVYRDNVPEKCKGTPGGMFKFTPPPKPAEPPPPQPTPKTEPAPKKRAAKPKVPRLRLVKGT